MSFRYIGSKARLVDAILDHIGKPDGGKFIDAFCGTGAVADAASKAGWPVLVNDHLASSSIMSLARVTSRKQVPFKKLGGYEGALAALNRAESVTGFIWREYSPASSGHCATERKYFTEHNAQRIDGIRQQISAWSREGEITDAEAYVLIADLMGAANRVANTAGTYGCFLSKWQRQSLDRLVLSPRVIPEEAPAASMSNRDVLEVECKPDDTVYLDPPYTKRQYAAYYHILETIALGDEPEVVGVCGIRPWQHIASDYCYKVRAADALEKLVATIPARRVFLSYSAEAHVPLEVLGEALQRLGNVVRNDLESVGRYRPNRAASEGGSEVGEVLFYVEKTAEASMVAA
ncbi:DNA adenine methylase [Lutimaribacter sp. EGI FJ00015]|uniref:DNA adenine methylase n=1 Tax=Lutimaribacter degradans TaxID=2945989 RepID=A0ACC5ZUD9_9RHOB|nr:DNA adenine methylase [Lutimaribacter sp. EGI FJ00013]MCM2561750.1 DNA adenine methylase [Lutimaribacter sp. EGI FJ00013]MCO0613218.1 DNA adenine methylase [Lutimaribacter sp. EGI FJ00015]MCO0635582.1 DNA adenine methylase [Lutimaribacter sp. EGI FJ00014]